jgi:hypothetical protein
MPETNKRTEQTKKNKQNQQDATSSRVNEEHVKERKPKWVASGGIKRTIWIGKNRKNQVERRRRRE